MMRPSWLRWIISRKRYHHSRNTIPYESKGVLFRQLNSKGVQSGHGLRSGFVWPHKKDCIKTDNQIRAILIFILLKTSKFNALLNSAPFV